MRVRYAVAGNATAAGAAFAGVATVHTGVVPHSADGVANSFREHLAHLISTADLFADCLIVGEALASNLFELRVWNVILHRVENATGRTDALVHVADESFGMASHMAEALSGDCEHCALINAKVSEGVREQQSPDQRQ